jgi:hypothetical protein
MDYILEFNKSNAITEPHFNHHTYEYKNAPRFTILRYMDLFLPCEICGTTTTPRQRCRHGTLICTNHHHEPFTYLDADNVPDRWHVYNPDAARQIPTHIKKAKKCDICKISKKANPKSAPCFLSSVLPIHTPRHTYPYRDSNNIFTQIHYYKKLLQHCCHHTQATIIHHYTFDKPHNKTLYIPSENKIYFKDQLTKCSICQTRYNSLTAGHHNINFNFSLTSSMTSSVVLVCPDCRLSITYHTHITFAESSLQLPTADKFIQAIKTLNEIIRNSKLDKEISTYYKLELLKTMSIFAFHGDLSTLPPPIRDRHMIEYLKVIFALRS